MLETIWSSVKVEPERISSPDPVEKVLSPLTAVPLDPGEAALWRVWRAQAGLDLQVLPSPAQATEIP